MGAKEEAKKLYDRNRIYQSANLGLATDDALKSALESRGYAIRKELITPIHADSNLKATKEQIDKDILHNLKERNDWEVIIGYRLDGELNFRVIVTDELKESCINDAIKRFTKIVETK